MYVSKNLSLTAKIEVSVEMVDKGKAAGIEGSLLNILCILILLLFLLSAVIMLDLSMKCTP